MNVLHASLDTIFCKTTAIRLALQKLMLTLDTANHALPDAMNVLLQVPLAQHAILEPTCSVLHVYQTAPKLQHISMSMNLNVSPANLPARLVFQPQSSAKHVCPHQTTGTQSLSSAHLPALGSSIQSL
jgi:hypothetical protein